MKQPLTCSSTDVSLAALGRPHLHAQHCIMKCVHCSEYDRAAASALGIVHLYMTGAHAAFEHPVSPLLPSLPPSPAHSHMHSKKRSRQLDAPLAPTAPRSSPPFPTHSLSGANMQSISPPGLRGVAALPLNCSSFLPFPSSVCRLSFHLLASGGKKRGGGDSWRELVFLEGKVWSRRSW